MELMINLKGSYLLHLLASNIHPALMWDGKPGSAHIYFFGYTMLWESFHVWHHRLSMRITSGSTPDFNPPPSVDKLQCFVCIAEQVTELLTGLHLIKNEWLYAGTSGRNPRPGSYLGLKPSAGDTMKDQYNKHQNTYDADWYQQQNVLFF